MFYFYGGNQPHFAAFLWVLLLNKTPHSSKFLAYFFKPVYPQVVFLKHIWGIIFLLR